MWRQQMFQRVLSETVGASTHAEAPQRNCIETYRDRSRFLGSGLFSHPTRPRRRRARE